MRIKLPSKVLMIGLLSSSSSSSSSVDAFTGNAISAAFVPLSRQQQLVRSAYSSRRTSVATTDTAADARISRTTSLFASSGGGNLFRPTKRRDDDDEDDEDDDEEEESLYEQFARSEFLNTESADENKITLTSSSSSSSSTTDPTNPSTNNNNDEKSIDWGGEYDTLRNRFNDVKNNKIGPSNTLFRIMTSQTPNEAIMTFIDDASPQVITAMSSTVSSMLGGLTNPRTGMNMIVKANGDKIGSLCFQLQMTGYMFRNAEYVLAIRDLMNIHGQASFQDYKNAFDKLDADKSGFIEADEVYDLLSDVYRDDNIPSYEVDAFLKFFDSNNDGRISWDEFERGLGVVADTKAKESRKKGRNSSAATSASAALPGYDDDNERVTDDDDKEEEDNDDEIMDAAEPNVSGKVKIEMKNGRIIEVEAKEYIEELKKEAEALKAALRREKGTPQQPPSGPSDIMSSPTTAGLGGLGDQQGQEGNSETSGIAGYIASLGGDMQSLTKGISPEVVDAMKMLIDFVLDGGTSGRGKGRKDDKDLEMEIPSSALQQLALWQLVLGYKLREAEATGEYRKMLE